MITSSGAIRAAGVAGAGSAVSWTAGDTITLTLLIVITLALICLSLVAKSFEG